MLYIPNNSIRPAFNQAFEQAVFEMCADDDILLLWRNTPCVVCGRNQNIFAEVDAARAARDGVEIIRRDTGGGTVFHDLGNINYAIMTDAKGIAVDYDSMLDIVVQALNELGIKAHKNRTCDIAIGDRKISGSAQRQTKTRVLHHGTMLYNTDLTALERYSKGVQGVDSKAIGSDRTHVTNISDHVRFRSADQFMEKLAERLIKGGRISEASSDVIKRAEELCNEKYLNWEWTFGKNPPFHCVRERDGIRIEYSAKHGIITDFIADSRYVPSDGSEFVGARLDCDTIHDICTRTVKGGHAEIFYKMIFGEAE